LEQKQRDQHQVPPRQDELLDLSVPEAEEEDEQEDYSSCVLARALRRRLVLVLVHYILDVVEFVEPRHFEEVVEHLDRLAVSYALAPPLMHLDVGEHL